MSGLELITAVGVAASAAQLVDYSLKVIGTISEIYSRVKDAQSRATQYTSQINQIIEVGQAIQYNHELQSPLINSQLQKTLVEVEQLHSVLSTIHRDYTTGSRRKRIWKAIVGDQERRIVASFETLEKEKTALILCIVVVHNETLQTIGNGVETLVERGSGVSELIKRLSRNGTKETIEDTAATVSANQTALFPRSNSGTPRDTAIPGTRDENSSRSQLQVEISRIYRNMQSFKNAAQVNGDYNDGGDYNYGSKTPHSYEGSKCSGRSFQVNGNYEGSGAHQYKNAQARGSSVQINGNISGGKTLHQRRKELGQLTSCRMEG